MNSESIHDEYEIVPLRNVKEVEKKILKMEKISNVSFISNNDKGTVNKKRLGMTSMLLPMNRVKARWEFIKYAA